MKKTLQVVQTAPLMSPELTLPGLDDLFSLDMHMPVAAQLSTPISATAPSPIDRHNSMHVVAGNGLVLPSLTRADLYALLDNDHLSLNFEKIRKIIHEAFDGCLLYSS